MILVTLTATVAAVLSLVAVIMAGQTLRGIVRQHARERDRLLDRIMHLAGATWTPPPADTYAPDEDEELEPERFLSTTAQLPEL